VERFSTGGDGKNLRREKENNFCWLFGFLKVGECSGGKHKKTRKGKFEPALAPRKKDSKLLRGRRKNWSRCDYFNIFRVHEKEKC